jgi:RND family efflux transporter MFP subunit
VKRRKWIAVAVAAFVVIVIVALVFRGGDEKAATSDADVQSAIPVEVATARMELADTSVGAPGTVEALAQAQLAPKIMSTVERVYIREGDRVRKGQTLLVLESRDLSAGVAQARAGLSVAVAGRMQAGEAARIQEVTSVTRVRQAEAQLSAARAGVSQAAANLDMVREGSRKQQKAQAAQGVAQAQAQYDLAKISYERMQNLFFQGVIAKQQLDETKAKHDVALAALTSAQQQQSMVDEGSRTQEQMIAEQASRQARGQLAIAEESLKAARAAQGETAIKREQIKLAAAQAQQARAGLVQAEVQQGYSVIRAPFDGVVTAKYVDAGTMVAPGAPLLVVQDVRRFRLVATVPEEKAQLAYKGLPAHARLDSVPGAVFDSTIDTVVPAADPRSRTFIVKSVLPPSPGVEAGAFGRLILPGRPERGIYLPEKSVWRSGQLTGVYVVGKDRMARLRLVTLGRPSGPQVQILSGVSSGDSVVVSDISRLSDGIKVSTSVAMLGRPGAVRNQP